MRRPIPTDREKILREFADEIQQGLEQSGHQHASYFEQVLRVSRLFHVYIVILDRDGTVKPLPQSNQLTIQWKDLLQEDDFRKVLEGNLSWIGNVSIKEEQDEDFSFSKHDVILVAAPYKVQGQVQGALLFYQVQRNWVVWISNAGFFTPHVLAFF